jgi:hypothetical protein
MSKCCLYATNDLKVCGGMKEVLIKDVQYFFQKKITWSKKSGKGKHEWAKAYRNAYFHPQKLIFFCQSKVILFNETWDFKHAINLYYSWQTIALQNIIPSP